MTEMHSMVQTRNLKTERSEK